MLITLNHQTSEIEETELSHILRMDQQASAPVVLKREMRKKGLHVKEETATDRQGSLEARNVSPILQLMRDRQCG